MKLIAAVVCAFGLSACAGSQTNARQELQQLMVLHQEARPKFVVQKQQMQQAEDCSRVVRLREAADQMVQEQGMKVEKDETLTLVHMELQQAEKACLEK